MTKQEFDLKYRSEKVAVHCDTEEKAKAFLSLAKSFGCEWNSKQDLDESFWEIYKKEMCYSLFKDERMSYGDLGYFEIEGYTIVEFELDEPNGYAIEDTPSPMEETFKVGDVVYTKMGFKVKIVDTAWIVEFENEYGSYFKRNSDLTRKKPLKKITKKELADMGYEVE